MKDENFEHSITFCWVCFAGKMPPATYCTEYYGFKRTKEEQGFFIQQKKIIDAGGIELKGVRPSPKPLNNQDLYISRASFFHLAELATSPFGLNLHHSDVQSRRL
jgi:hypothetical protein